MARTPQPETTVFVFTGGKQTRNIIYNEEQGTIQETAIRENNRHMVGFNTLKHILMRVLQTVVDWLKQKDDNILKRNTFFKQQRNIVMQVQMKKRQT